MSATCPWRKVAAGAQAGGSSTPVCPRCAGPPARGPRGYTAFELEVSRAQLHTRTRACYTNRHAHQLRAHLDCTFRCTRQSHRHVTGASGQTENSSVLRPLSLSRPHSVLSTTGCLPIGLPRSHTPTLGWCLWTLLDKRPSVCWAQLSGCGDLRAAPLGLCEPQRVHVPVVRVSSPPLTLAWPCPHRASFSTGPRASRLLGQKGTTLWGSCETPSSGEG